MKTYIKITQDGIGRIFFNQRSDIDGLCTDNLETCLAIVLIGNLGISLTHNTGRIAQKTLQHELSIIGELEKCHIIFNGAHHDKKSAVVFLGSFLSTIDGTKIAWGKSTAITINKDKNICSKPSVSDTIESAPQIKRRHHVNVYNNILSKDGGSVSGDLQFDGDKFTECPALLGSIEEVKTAIRQRDMSLDQKLIFLSDISDFEQLEQETESRAHSAFSTINIHEIVDQLNKEYETSNQHSYATSIQALFRGHRVRASQKKSIETTEEIAENSSLKANL